VENLAAAGVTGKLSSAMIMNYFLITLVDIVLAVNYRPEIMVAALKTVCPLLKLSLLL
jgi:hypothetical protein